MWRPLLLALTFGTLAPPAAAETRPQGLLWNRSGLAATLPLQVKTNDGSDHLLQLVDAETAQAVLAAYIRGGQFFRVLVPPGHFLVLFATGTDWQSEATQFGPDTERVLLTPPLSFRATVSQKNGYLIDLRDPAEITLRDFAICQRSVLEPQSLRDRYPAPRHPFWRDETRRLSDLEFTLRRYEVQSRVCD